MKGYEGNRFPEGGRYLPGVAATFCDCQALTPLSRSASLKKDPMTRESC